MKHPGLSRTVPLSGSLPKVAWCRPRYASASLYGFRQSPSEDLNPSPTAYEAVALPDELDGQKIVTGRTVAYVISLFLG